MKAVWIVIGLIIVAGAVWLLADRQPEPATDTSTNETESPAPGGTDSDATDPEPESVVITYTDSGFVPTTVTINIGDSVVFKNESSRTFRPASDPHPVHTDLSGFDSDTAVAVGQSYTFTFNKSGSWGFHDHLDSGKKGTVVVR